MIEDLNKNRTGPSVDDRFLPEFYLKFNMKFYEVNYHDMRRKNLPNPAAPCCSDIDALSRWACTGPDLLHQASASHVYKLGQSMVVCVLQRSSLQHSVKPVCHGLRNAGENHITVIDSGRDERVDESHWTCCQENVEVEGVGRASRNMRRRR